MLHLKTAIRTSFPCLMMGAVMGTLTYFFLPALNAHLMGEAFALVLYVRSL